MKVELINTSEYYGEDWGDGPGFSGDKLQMIYGECKLSYYVREDEPEDMNFGRSLQDCSSIISMIKKAYEAGKSGHELEIKYETEK